MPFPHNKPPMPFSPEALKVLSFMLKDLSSLKKEYRNTIKKSYDDAINEQGLRIPKESKDDIISFVSDTLLSKPIGCSIC